MDPAHHTLAAMHRTVRLSTRMPVLFARYVAGQINDKAWQAFSDVIDSIEATMEERAALAEFFSDAIEELGLDAIKLPKRHEAEAMVAAMRVTS